MSKAASFPKSHNFVYLQSFGVSTFLGEVFGVSSIQITQLIPEGGKNYFLKKNIHFHNWREIYQLDAVWLFLNVVPQLICITWLLCITW